MFKLFFSLVIVVCLSSCVPEEKSDFDTLVQELEIQTKQAKAILIIPLDGCNGCVETTIAFIKKYPHEEGLVSVITDHGMKQSEMLGLIDLSNQIVIDSKARAKKLGLVQSYPTLYYLSKGKKPEAIELTGATVEETLNDLRSQLQTQHTTQ